MRRDAFQLRGLITKSCGVTLPVTEMMATKRLQKRAIFRQPASVCLYFLVICFLGVWYRCTWLQICFCLFWTVVPGLQFLTVFVLF